MPTRVPASRPGFPRPGFRCSFPARLPDCGCGRRRRAGMCCHGGTSRRRVHRRCTRNWIRPRKRCHTSSSWNHEPQSARRHRMRWALPFRVAPTPRPGPRRRAAATRRAFREVIARTRYRPDQTASRRIGCRPRRTSQRVTHRGSRCRPRCAPGSAGHRSRRHTAR